MVGEVLRCTACASATRFGNSHPLALQSQGWDKEEVESLAGRQIQTQAAHKLESAAVASWSAQQRTSSMPAAHPQQCLNQVGD